MAFSLDNDYISTQDRSKSALVKSTLPMLTNKEYTIGMCVILFGVSYLVTAAYLNGMEGYKLGEYNALKSLGLINCSEPVDSEFH